MKFCQLFIRIFRHFFHHFIDFSFYSFSPLFSFLFCLLFIILATIMARGLTLSCYTELQHMFFFILYAFIEEIRSLNSNTLKINTLTGLEQSHNV